MVSHLRKMGSLNGERGKCASDAAADVPAVPVIHRRTCVRVHDACHAARSSALNITMNQLSLSFPASRAGSRRSPSDGGRSPASSRMDGRPPMCRSGSD